MDKQNERVLQYLKTHKKGITSWDAIMKMHITRLGARIFDLKEKGYNIVTVLEPNKDNNANHARYVLMRCPNETKKAA